MSILIKRKKIKLTIAVVCLVFLVCGVTILGVYYFNSTTHIIKQYEKNWGIDLPEQLKLDFRSSKTHIDGNVEYLVFTSKYDLSEELFLKMDSDINKEDFESWFINAINGLGSSSGELNIPAEHRPDLSREYNYLVLQRMNGVRYSYFYLLFYPETMTVIICSEISQYQHQTKIGP